MMLKDVACSGSEVEQTGTALLVTHADSDQSKILISWGPLDRCGHAKWKDRRLVIKGPLKDP